MVKKYFRFLTILSLAASVSMFASGCAQQTKVDVNAGTETDATASQVDISTSQPTPTEETIVSTPLGTEESLDSSGSENGSSLPILEGRTTGPMLPVYFDYDQSNIRADQKSRIEGNARHMKSMSNSRLVIEGNCDERGTNEYNMALGERRANSAKKYLVNLGVAERMIKTISYGEERPLNHGHDELAWSQNRRDDFVELR